MAKGKAMLDVRPAFSSQLDFVQIQDFEQLGVFDEAIKEIDAVIHVASVCLPTPDEPKLCNRSDN